MKLYAQFRGVLSAMAVCALCIAPASSLTPTTSYQLASPDVLITEVQTGTTLSGSDEFIELYNNSDATIDFADSANGGKTQWKLQYFAKSKLAAMLPGSSLADGWNMTGGSANTATKTIILNGSIAPRSYFVLSALGYNPGSIETDMNFSSGLAADGGALQLVSVETLTPTTTKTNIYDRVAWAGASLDLESNWIQTPPIVGNTLQRTLNAEDRYTDENNVLAPWDVGAMTPKSTWEEAQTDGEPVRETEPPVDTTPPVTDPVGEDPKPQSNEGLVPPVITELLPNPASDEGDEFIELYNPNTEAFDLKGFELQTGTSSIHSFVITSDTMLPAEKYTVLKYDETKLALSNSGGRSRLLNTAKQIVSETAVYGTAKEGLSWSIDDLGIWRWTDTVTPEAENLITMAQSPLQAIVARSKLAQAQKVKGVSTKKSATPKAKVAKKKTPKAPKKAKKSKTAAQHAKVPSAAEKPASIHIGALATVAVAALAYISYEYRKDIANFFAKFRRH